MIAVEAFYIDIVDTQDSSSVLQLEDTAIDSVQLIYNGKEDRFGNITSSELHFSLLSENAIDGKYFHLFTGSETRYQVQLLDATHPDIPKILWAGFLLPEQFEEPYQAGNFFTDLIATDGLGRLRNLKSPQVFNSQKISVIQVLHTILFQTGLVLDIHFSKGIDNAFFDLYYLDLEVDTHTYIEDDLSLYEVLEKLLTSIGCLLFEYENAWWVLGLSRLAEKEIPYRVYPFALPQTTQEIQSKLLVREQLSLPFEATPKVSVLPPLQMVKAVWDDKEDSFVVPEDLVSHFPKYYSNDKTDTTPRYWRLVTDGKIHSFAVFVVHEFSLYDLDSLYYTSGQVKVNFKNTISGPFFYLESRLNPLANDFNQTSGVLTEDISSNYITLEEPFYLDLQTSELLSFELILNIPKRASATDQQLRDAIENKSLKGLVVYSIIFQKFKKSEQSEFVISNFSGDSTKDDAFDFLLSYHDGKVNARVFIEEFQLLQKGYYNIRLYPVIGHDLLGSAIYFETCHLKLKNPKSKDFSLEREIDFTTEHTLEVYHSSTERTTTTRKFYFSDRIVQEIESGQLIGDQFLVEQRYYNSTVNTLGQVIYLIGLKDHDFYRFENGYEFYVQKSGSPLLQRLPKNSYVVSEDPENGKYFFQMDFNLPFLTHYYVQQDDTLYLKPLEQGAEIIRYAAYYSNTFKRYYSDQVENFTKALIQTHHDLLDTYKVRFTANLLHLVSPLDMLFFPFRGMNLGTITNLQLNLTEATSEVTLVDHKRGNIQNEVISNAPDLNPSILTTAELFPPSTVWSILNYNPWYYLNVGYQIRNLYPIQAQLQAVQLDGNPNSIFSTSVNPTGLIIQSTLSEAEGTFRFDFPNPLQQYQGYYEVSVYQGGVTSEKTIIYLPPDTNDPRSVVLTKLWVEQVNIPDRSVFRMFYTLQTSGFDPEPSTGIQYVGMTTLIVIQNPNEVQTAITLGQNQYMAEFEGVAGFYVRVQVDGVLSNLIHSYL